MRKINPVPHKKAIFCMLKVFTNQGKEVEKYAKNGVGKMS